MSGYQDPTAEARPHWNPQLFGPVPDLEGEVATGGTSLFAGDERALGRRRLRQRIQLMDRVAPRLQHVLEEGETIAWMAPALEIPPLTHQLGLGWLWFYFYQMALVITDRRLFEVELGVRGRGLGSRTRSWQLKRLKHLKLTWRGVAAQPLRGRKVVWRLRQRRDRRFIRPLLDGMAKRPVFGAEPGATPLWHCPICGAASEEHPARCSGCATQMRSPRTATLLALAFPGAGLLYAGHPVLALFDLLGEVLVFILLAFSILLAAPGELVTVMPLFLFLLILTKIESVHLSRIFTHRTVPARERAAGVWPRLAMVGAVLSLLFVLGPLAFVGRLVEAVERDLAPEAEGWSVERNPAEWLASEPNQRSEWWGPGEIVVTVNAYPLGGETFQSWVDEIARAAEDTALSLPPGPMSGARLTSQLSDSDGNEWLRLLFLVHDAKNDDAHLLYLDCPPEDGDFYEKVLLDLMAEVAWIKAVPPG